MSSQNPASNRGSRTYWTPRMERYFIDLMLEHIHRGNRTGHTFNKQAWTDMLDVFNAKFGSQYDKDVLKGRYTNLWKQFNDIKNLLGQSGFSWDETQQMVVADDYLWDAHIKIHPEARPYKTKSILNFNDLCLIYGYTVADGRYSRSSHDLDVDDEVNGTISGNGNSGMAPSSSSKTEWTPDMDDCFINLMLKQQERGNKNDTTFTKQAWTDMLALFNAKFGSDYNKRVLRHRYKKLSKYYSDLMTLAKQKGFCWDEKEQMVVADDNVWDAYIKAHPHARSYRNKKFPNYNNLQLITGDIVSKESQSGSHQDTDVKNDHVAANGGTVHSRTYWTPPMDRFFIDLMLEQVHKGNRIGQSFIAQAWNDMIASFNENFRSQHDKEILKNRYKHFKKQYNDVKILLEHGGFLWDEGREIVTAEDCIWDDYIKAHPDARPYRVKKVPCYHKLRVIYGQDKLEGVYSSLAGSVTLTNETSGNGKYEDPSVSIDVIEGWTIPMERYLIDLMLEQVRQGNKVGDTFNDQAWAHMTFLFKDRFGEQYDQCIIENQFLSLMKQYNEISKLLNQNGFAWDETLQMIVADNNVWDSNGEEQSDAISYKDKMLPHYGDFGIIFGPNEITGELSLSGENVRLNVDQDPIDARTDEHYGNLPTPVLDSETSALAKKRQAAKLTALEPRSKVQRSSKEGTSTNLTGVAAKEVKMEDEKTSVAIASVIGALQAIPDIDDELLLDGCDLLEDEKKAKTFLALDATFRKKWLLRKLGRS